MTDWISIKYLKEGNEKQRKSYEILTESSIMDILKAHSPIVVGTLPIHIDVEWSDIDIICYAKDLNMFQKTVQTNFSDREAFYDKIFRRNYVSSFIIHRIPIEIYAEPVPTRKQNGYRHMIVEWRILEIAGKNFKNEIIKLKNEGYKTEPAFGKLLMMQDPYKELLLLEQLSDSELTLFLSDKI